MATRNALTTTGSNWLPLLLASSSQAFSCDIARRYGSDRLAAAFQHVLDRLVAANAIAYIREADAIHIAAASDAPAKLKLLEALG